MVNTGRLKKKGDKEHLDLQVALLGFNIATEVAGGENRGRELIHQFSVLEHSSKRSSTNSWTLPTPQSAIEAESLALAVWVTPPNSQQPLQATGGWLQ
ncbi:MAG: hypothetical protein ACI9JM_003479 [Halioglobus sp.]|jgi:hypothetical protein